MECMICFNVWSYEEFVPRILSCGHSLCQVCAEDLFKEPELTCPTCLTPTCFDLQRAPKEDSQTFNSRVIGSLPKNFTLLSLLSTRPVSQSQVDATAFSFGVKCESHGLLIHSFTVRPYSLACDMCIEEYQGMKLAIEPFPEVVQYISSHLITVSESVGVNLQELHSGLARLKQCKQTNIELESQLDRRGAELNEAIEEEFRRGKSEFSKNSGKFTESVRVETEFYQRELELCKEEKSEINRLLALPNQELVQSYTLIQESSRTPSTWEQRGTQQVQNLDYRFAPSAPLMNLLKSYLEVQLCKKTTGTWECDECHQTSPSGDLFCEICECFRPLHTYAHLLHDPFNVTEEELYELEQRRKLECKLVREKDEQANNEGEWCIINADWIHDWKNFILNRPSRNSKLVSPNPAIGSLPPGRVNNYTLFKDVELTELRDRLKPVANYRGVNSRIWSTYIKWYKGGPVIKRKKISIYES